jgi:DNA primase
MKRVKKGRPCEICGRDRWCGYSEDGTKAVCMRVESEHPTKNRGWLHILEDVPSARPTPSPRPLIHSHELAPRERLHEVYTALLDRLSLSDAHRANLLSRGLSESDIASHGFKSAPRSTPDLPGLDLRGVPGFYRERGGWQLVSYGSGFYVPVRDSRGSLRGFQVRKDVGSPRYLWLSSASKPEGASSGAPLHFTGQVSGRLLITEGALKADCISSRLNVPVLGLPGVSGFPKGFGRKLRRLFPALSKIYLCFDSDFKTNEHVGRALFTLLAELRAALYSPSVLTWDTGKGFDDYLVRQAA